MCLHVGINVGSDLRRLVGPFFLSLTRACMMVATLFFILSSQKRVSLTSFIKTTSAGGRRMRPSRGWGSSSSSPSSSFSLAIRIIQASRQAISVESLQMMVEKEDSVTIATQHRLLLFQTGRLVSIPEPSSCY